MSGGYGPKEEVVGDGSSGSAEAPVGQSAARTCEKLQEPVRSCEDARVYDEESCKLIMMHDESWRVRRAGDGRCKLIMMHVAHGCRGGDFPPSCAAHARRMRTSHCADGRGEGRARVCEMWPVGTTMMEAATCGVREGRGSFLRENKGVWVVHARVAVG